MLSPLLCLSLLLLHRPSEAAGDVHRVGSFTVAVAESRAHITGDQAVAAENIKVIDPGETVYPVALYQTIFFRSNYDVAWFDGAEGTITGSLRLYVDGVLVDETPLEDYTLTATGPHREPHHRGEPEYQAFKVGHRFTETGIHEVVVEVTFTAESAAGYAEDTDRVSFLVNVVPWRL